MIERLLRLAVRQGATSLSVIINQESPEVGRFLLNTDFRVPLKLIVKSTPSSMHSLFELSFFLRGVPFCLFTVDTIFQEEEFARFLQYCRYESQACGVLAITPFIDDEKPLWVETDSDQRILSFSDALRSQNQVTGGIYYFSPSIFSALDQALVAGMMRLRNFLRLLLEKGHSIKAFSFSKIIDVDRLSDIRTAEDFLSHGDLSSQGDKIP